MHIYLFDGLFTTEEIMIDNIQNNTQEQLRSFIERIERLEQEKKVLSENIKEVYSEAKATGFDIKALRKIISLRKKDEQEWIEEEQILDVYLRALGMIKEE
ncbi:hypothetical protein lam_756 [Candidatus Liberibacter americanus str. Sao Paulo]|uniref:UPF0335 protein lam_756 n=2 Tax=Candidatus Liberibacter americanus TaxID=309868 RepID=U6B4V4_9HYPH|nr:hypothetical protein lam_756 [Candidatus Liberibacter americanus str. Sao Paulo]